MSHNKITDINRNVDHIKNTAVVKTLVTVDEKIDSESVQSRESLLVKRC